jgi:hypothetical protein
MNRSNAGQLILAVFLAMMILALQEPLKSLAQGQSATLFGPVQITQMGLDNIEHKTTYTITGLPGTGFPVVPGTGTVGTYANGGVALSTSAVQIFNAPSASPRYRIKMINSSGISTAGGPPIVEWCRWGLVGSAPAAAGGVGSFALQPGGGGIDDQGAGVNQNAVNCIAESGTPVIYAEQY